MNEFSKTNCFKKLEIQLFNRNYKLEIRNFIFLSYHFLKHFSNPSSTIDKVSKKMYNQGIGSRWSFPYKLHIKICDLQTVNGNRNSEKGRF